MISKWPSQDSNPSALAPNPLRPVYIILVHCFNPRKNFILFIHAFSEHLIHVYNFPTTSQAVETPSPYCPAASILVVQSGEVLMQCAGDMVAQGRLGVLIPIEWARNPKEGAVRQPARPQAKK